MKSSFQPSISQAQATPLPMRSQAKFEARIDALWVFPIKSCAGISVQQAMLTHTGLAHDRAWMVVDADGEMVTQRELPRLALIQPNLLLSGASVSELVIEAKGMTALHLPLSVEHISDAQAVKVRIWGDQVPAFDLGAESSQWLTEFLGGSLGPLRLVRFDDKHQRPSNVKWTQGLPSLNQFSDGFPVLVASNASLDELNARLQAMDESSVDMRRFRANVVLGDSIHADALTINAHDEDRIDTLTIYTKGEPAQLKPVKPCPRCPIPNIDPDSAQSSPVVNAALQTYRQDPRVNGALTFGMNCLPTAGIGQVLSLGQRVSADWVF
jgi:uncharacterized protein YcbX